MSLASVHGPQFADICSPLARNNLSMSSTSLSDFIGSPFDFSVDSTMMTIEELRQNMGSCFTCGVSWTDEHVSLDCSECGGYSTQRPCPLCDGQCGVQWKRDFTTSHACNKARWLGVCTIYPDTSATVAAAAAAAVAASNANSAASSAHNTLTAGNTCAQAQFHLAKELCTRLEKLTTAPQPKTNAAATTTLI